MQVNTGLNDTVESTTVPYNLRFVYSEDLQVRYMTTFWNCPGVAHLSRRGGERHR